MSLRFCSLTGTDFKASKHSLAVLSSNNLSSSIISSEDSAEESAPESAEDPANSPNDFFFQMHSNFLNVRP